MESVLTFSGFFFARIFTSLVSSCIEKCKRWERAATPRGFALQALCVVIIVRSISLDNQCLITIKR